jgi:hypothetical protein
MPHMIRAELVLIAVCRQTVWSGHNARIVDQYVQSLLPPLECICGRGDRSEGHEIEREELDWRIRDLFLDI